MENSFDRIENLVPVPGSSRKEKTVCLGVKVLQTKKETRKILPEEKYIENLEKIIVRDYFPELPKLQAQSEYLEAVARNDQFKIRELHIRYNTSRCTDMKTTPYGNSTLTPYTPSVFDPDTPGPSVEQSPYANKDGDNEALVGKFISHEILLQF